MSGMSAPTRDMVSLIPDARKSIRRTFFARPPCDSSIAHRWDKRDGSFHRLDCRRGRRNPSAMEFNQWAPLRRQNAAKRHDSAREAKTAIGKARPQPAGHAAGASQPQACQQRWAFRPPGRGLARCPRCRSAPSGRTSKGNPTGRQAPPAPNTPHAGQCFPARSILLEYFFCFSLLRGTVRS